MAHQTFTDSNGIRWDVWEVFPQWADRRLLSGDRRSAPRASPDRRRRSETRVKLGEQAKGWLCFLSAIGKRRLHPIPEQWARLSREELEELCACAEPVPKRQLN